jgi:hypothetical protein
MRASGEKGGVLTSPRNQTSGLSGTVVYLEGMSKTIYVKIDIRVMKASVEIGIAMIAHNARTEFATQSCDTALCGQIAIRRRMLQNPPLYAAADGRRTVRRIKGRVRNEHQFATRSKDGTARVRPDPNYLIYRGNCSTCVSAVRA